jgi:hypothetical protein
MKKLILSVFVSTALVFSAFSQGGAIASGANISFEKDVHDFGNLKQGGDATYEFKFKNTGNEPLIISNAQGSCGCTVPEWPKEPIKPGASSVIKVKYDSKRVGPINKSVTITSNSTENATFTLRIAGNIEAVPQEAEQAFPMQKAPEGAPVEKN